MAERVGFEPTVRRTYDGFQDRSVMTTSVSLRICLNILSQLKANVNSFLKNFSLYLAVFKSATTVSKKTTFLPILSLFYTEITLRYYFVHTSQL